MKDNNIYIINTSLLDATIQEFVDNNSGITINRTDTTNEVMLEITDGTRRGLLHLYYKEGGNFSHYEQGDWTPMAIACWSHIYTKLGMVVENKSLPAIRDVEKVDFEAFVDCFKALEDYSVEKKETNAIGVDCIYVIENSSHAKVTLTFYKKKAMLIQGASNGLLVKVLSECIDTIPQADSTLIDFILPPDKQVKTVLDVDLSKHISNTAPITGGKIEKLINTSLKLINSSIIIDDYSPFTTNVLRALDAVMNGKIKQVAEPVTSYHDYFEGDPSTGYKMIPAKNPFAEDEEMTTILEDAYTYYHNHRHPISHTDHQNVETTRILSYEEAAIEIRETLAIINRICSKW